MTPTALFELLKNCQKDFDPELVESYKRLDSGAIEMKLKSGNAAVFRIDPRSKKLYLILDLGKVGGPDKEVWSGLVRSD